MAGHLGGLPKECYSLRGALWRYSKLRYSAALDFASAFRTGSFQSGRMKWQV